MPRKTDYAPHIAPEHAPPCHIDGCGERGAYKAPKSRERLHDYLWLCLEHVREHNKQWDYFAGMDGNDIEHFMRDAVIGHRPTWNRETGMRQPFQRLQDALYEFMHAGHKAPKPAPPLSGKLRKALALMEMEYPYTTQELKAQYRAMVKKHHPDLNQGDKRSEEAFKKITAAYRALADYLASQP